MALPLGLLAGLFCYLALVPFETPWAEALAAGVIGAAAGAAARHPKTALAGAAACGLGWAVGAFVFSSVVQLGIGMWLPAGACLGGVGGLLRGSWRRLLAGLGLGLVAGLGAELARFLPVLVEPLRAFDMQLMVLLLAGLLLPVAAALVTGPGEERAR